MNPPSQMIVISGSNGAGKSTIAPGLLSKEIESINADDVARTLSTYPSQEADLAAGRIVLNRLDELEARRADFAIETTLAGISLAQRIERLRNNGYLFHLIFLWTPNAEFSIQRVASRVRAGGHSIPEKVINRRHAAGLFNFFTRYQPIADKWNVFNNTSTLPTLVAEGRLDEEPTVTDVDVWKLMRRGGRND